MESTLRRCQRYKGGACDLLQLHALTINLSFPEQTSVFNMFVTYAHCLSLNNSSVKTNSNLALSLFLSSTFHLSTLMYSSHWKEFKNILLNSIWGFMILIHDFMFDLLLYALGRYSTSNHNVNSKDFTLSQEKYLNYSFKVEPCVDYQGSRCFLLLGLFPYPTIFHFVIEYSIDGVVYELMSGDPSLIWDTTADSVFALSSNHVQVIFSPYSNCNIASSVNYGWKVINKSNSKLILLSIEMHIDISQPFVQHPLTRIFQHGFQVKLYFQAIKMYRTPLPLMGNIYIYIYKSKIYNNNSMIHIYYRAGHQLGPLVLMLARFTILHCL